MSIPNSSPTVPTFELTSIRQYVQKCAKEQWTNLKPDRMVCVGMKPFPGSIQNTREKANAIIAWFNDMRATFDLHDLPATFIITFGERNHMVLISSALETFADS
jgi:hypothetical protein